MGEKRDGYVTRVMKARSYSLAPIQWGLLQFQLRREFAAKMKEKELVGKLEGEVLKENLEVAAYYHWLNRGCPNNDELLDWVEAGMELAGRASKAEKVRCPPP